MRELPQAARDLWRRFEAGPDGSFAARRYEDPPGSGDFSIGWGHQILPHEAWVEPITLDQANEQMEFDLENAASEVDRLVVPSAMVDLTDGQYTALIDFVGNEGAGHFERSTLLKLINQHAFGRASEEFPRWDFVSGEPSAGLLRRRKVEKALWDDEAAAA